MNSNSIAALQYFAGRVVTVFVKGQLQRAFDDRQFNDYFVGHVDWINEDGLMTTHPLTGCKNYYCLGDIVGIVEEQVLHPDDPADAEIIKAFSTKTAPKPEPTSPYADIEMIEELTRQAKALEDKRKK